MGDTRETIEHFMKLTGARDPAIADLFAEPVDFYAPGEGVLPWAGARSNRAEVLDFFQTLWPLTTQDGGWTERFRLFIEGEEAVLVGAFGHEVARTGERFVMEIAFTVTVREGRITRLHLIEDTVKAGRMFGLMGD